MKTIELEVSETIYEQVIAFLQVLPYEQVRIVEHSEQHQQNLERAFEEAVKLNIFAEVKDPVAWQREIRKDRLLPGRE
jgi:hypothetical protein